MLRAGDQRDRAVGLETHVDILVRRAAGRLDVIGDAQPAQPAAPFALAPARVEARPVGACQRMIERLGEVAAVDLEAEGVGHGHRFRWHHVAPAEIGAVEAGLPRRRIDQTLDDVDGLGEARPARYPDRRGVGDDRHDVQRDRGDAVHGALQMDVLERLHAAAGAGHVGTEIGDTGDPERQELALVVERQRRLGLHVARGMVGQEHFAAARDPLHRPADPARRPQDQRVLDIREVLGAEAAAHVGCHEPHALRLDAERAGHEVAVDVDVLAGDMECVAAGRRIEGADAATRLHRIHHDAMVVEPERDDMRRCRERRLGAGPYRRCASRDRCCAGSRRQAAVRPLRVPLPARLRRAEARSRRRPVPRHRVPARASPPRSAPPARRRSGPCPRPATAVGRRRRARRFAHWPRHRAAAASDRRPRRRRRSGRPARRGPRGRPSCRST